MVGWDFLDKHNFFLKRNKNSGGFLIEDFRVDIFGSEQPFSKVIEGDFVPKWGRLQDKKNQKSDVSVSKGSVNLYLRGIDIVGGLLLCFKRKHQGVAYAILNN